MECFLFRSLDHIETLLVEMLDSTWINRGRIISFVNWKSKYCKSKCKRYWMIGLIWPSFIYHGSFPRTGTRFWQFGCWFNSKSYNTKLQVDFPVRTTFFVSLGQTTISKSSPGICSNCKYGLSLWRKTYGIVLNNIIIKGNLFFRNWGRVHMV